jgi:DNA-binding MarR family transcriptional regulator
MKMFIDRFLKHIHNLPEQHKMLVSVSYADDMITKHFEIILDKYSLTPPQYNILRILQGTYPKVCRVREIQDMIIDKNSDVSRLIERLRKNGFVDRTTREGDRRAVDVLISEKGLMILERIIKLEEANMFGPFYSLTEKEAKQLNLLLQKLLSSLKVVTLPR